MVNVYDKANELAGLIKQSDEYKAVRQNQRRSL